MGKPSDSQSNLCWNWMHLSLPSARFEGHLWDFEHLCQLVLYESQNVPACQPLLAAPFPSAKSTAQTEGI